MVAFLLESLLLICSLAIFIVFLASCQRTVECKLLVWIWETYPKNDFREGFPDSLAEHGRGVKVDIFIVVNNTVTGFCILWQHQQIRIQEEDYCEKDENRLFHLFLCFSLFFLFFLLLWWDFQLCGGSCNLVTLNEGNVVGNHLPPHGLVSSWPCLLSPGFDVFFFWFIYYF